MRTCSSPRAGSRPMGPRGSSRRTPVSHAGVRPVDDLSREDARRDGPGRRGQRGGSPRVEASLDGPRATDRPRGARGALSLALRVPCCPHQPPAGALCGCPRHLPVHARAHPRDTARDAPGQHVPRAIPPTRPPAGLDQDPVRWAPQSHRPPGARARPIRARAPRCAARASRRARQRARIAWRHTARQRYRNHRRIWRRRRYRAGRGRTGRRAPCAAILSGVRPRRVAPCPARPTIEGPAMVRPSRSARAHLLPNGCSARAVGQPGCISGRPRRDRNVTPVIRVLRPTAVTRSSAPPAPSTRPPTRLAPGPIAP